MNAGARQKSASAATPGALGSCAVRGAVLQEMRFKPIPISWHGYVAAVAAVMAGVAAVQKKWTSVLVEAAACIFFFIREAQVQATRRRQQRADDRSAPDRG
jgi:hypothetical protein